MTTDAQPFSSHPSFPSRADYAIWYAKTFPDAPAWAHAAAAGDPKTYLEAIQRLTKGQQQ